MPTPKRPVQDWLTRLIADSANDNRTLPIDTPAYSDPDPDPRPSAVILIAAFAAGIVVTGLILWGLS